MVQVLGHIKEQGPQEQAVGTGRDMVKTCWTSLDLQEVGSMQCQISGEVLSLQLGFL